MLVYMAVYFNPDDDDVDGDCALRHEKYRFVSPLPLLLHLQLPMQPRLLLLPRQLT